MKLNILWAIPCTVQKKKKKNEKIKNDDLDLFYEYFSSIMSCEYPFIEKKNWPKLTKKNLFRHFYQESWLKSVLEGTGMFSLLIFYQKLNKRSKQHSVLHFLTGKLDQTGFPHRSVAIWFICHMWESTWKKTTSSVESLIYL